MSNPTSSRGTIAIVGPGEWSRGRRGQDDLTRVLRYGFNFKGKFAFSMPMPYHPNPCLHIDGIGIVGLPLSDRDAHLIAAAGLPTDEDMVQDTILVNRHKVSFKNPKWESYVDEVVREHVWEKLGCAPYKTAPRCEFHKLLLQKPGTRFFSSADVEMPPGTFATIIIVLPSEFKGGNIRLSHDGENLTLETAAGSLHKTNLLTWYTNVSYETENLTSGYRLALAYNLAHTPDGTPLPGIPSESTLAAHIREVFRRWVFSGYEGIPDDHVAAYVLDEDDRVECDSVLSALKAAADAENICLLLGTLCAHVTGWAEASTSEKPPYGLFQGTLRSPIMKRLYRVKFKVRKLTDIKGRPTHIKIRFILDEDNLVPEFPFRGIAPDEQHLHQFDGNNQLGRRSAGIFWLLGYERPVLVSFPNSKQLDVLLASGGVGHAIAELEESVSEGPTRENQKIMEYIFGNWHKTPPEYFMFDFRPSYEVPIIARHEITTNLADIAVQSNDAKLWVRTIGICEFKDEVGLNRFGLQRIVAAWDKFQLEEIKTALDRIMNGLEDVLGALLVLEALGSLEEVSHPETRRSRWLSEHLDRSFSKEAKGIMPPLLSQSLGVGFWATVIDTLRGSNDRLLIMPPSQGQTLSNQELFDNILEDARRAMPRISPISSVDSEDYGSE
ncbi:hypothetical protein BDM02DRAFT_3127503 [Thelephora ganbajun]|uniref:Uncharacterized protein n=1 Tax=Thelephora ganbajun TaxID=370292 RepID=A0ACB6ZMQ3_THEGA|nr:hypothetical protein BDM02DRAFT_3127503 [Thelephora ganbajun]